MLDGILEQLEEDRAARFVLDGQTVLLEDYLAIKPENAARLTRLIRRGALEAGPWYVLSDLLIPSGASLRRNLREGTADAERFGRRLAVLYSPDAFGHPAELPRLAAEFGIGRAVVRRGLGRPGGRDRDLYRWRAGEQASLLVYHLPSGGYDTAIELGAEGVDLHRAWPPIRRQLVQRAMTSEIAVFLGADHHAMPRKVAGLRALLAALEPEHAVRVSGLTEFFDAVERAAPDLPTITGELRSAGGHAWLLQGAHSARSRLKRRHSRAELLLSRIAEPLARLGADAGGPEQEGLLRAAWRLLLQSQFHDTLAGTTGDAVQREQEVRLDSVDALSLEIARTGLFALAGHDPDRDRESPRVVLWNPSDQRRSGILAAELTFFRKDVIVGAPGGRRPRTGAGHVPFALVDGAGVLHPVQLLAARRDQARVDAPRHYPDQDEVDRVWVALQVPEIGGKGIVSLTPRPYRRGPPAGGLRVGAGALRNDQLAITVSPLGALTVDDRKSGAHFESLGELADQVEGGDLYTRSGVRDAPRPRIVPTGRRILARGPLIGAVETSWAIYPESGGSIGVRQVVALYSDSHLVRLRYDIQNEATDHRLVARFPVGAGGESLAGSAMGSIRRAPVESRHRAGALERAAATAPAQRFVAAGEGARGLAVFSEGFFEYEWTRRGELSITLLRAVGELSRADLAERPGHAAWPMATPEAQEPGQHTIYLALTPLAAADRDDQERLERLWEEAFLPLQAIQLGGSRFP